MSNDKNGKNVEELADEDLDKVAGGTGGISLYDYINYRRAFMERNNCSECGNEFEDSCPLWLDHKGLYDTFNGNPDAMCSLYKM